VTEKAFERVIGALRGHGCKVIEKSGEKAESTCPAHEDTQPSLSVTGIQGQTLVHCHRGCDYRDVVAAIELTPADLYDERSATYRYDDGRTVKRFYDDRGKKRFAQTGASSTSVLYHLTRLQAVAPGTGVVYLTEGEKDVHAIEAVGGVATTAPQGAESFHKVDVGPLAGHYVAVIVDRDEAGQKWAAQVRAKLAGITGKVRYYHAKEGKDAADHIAAGYDLEDFERIALDESKVEPVEEWADEEEERFQFAVQRKLRDLRAMDVAREILAEEKHAQSWKPPESFGTLADELAIPAPEVSWRFKGMLGAGHNALLIATRKAGKTTLVNHATKCLADGDPLLGRFDTTPVDGGIAVFNYEVGDAQYREWMRDVRIENTDKIHMLHLRGKRLPIGDPRVREWIVQWLTTRGIKVWILDPYSRAAIGTVDNGNDEMKVGAFLDHLDVIKAEAGVQELIIPAHTPKAKVESGGESASGSQRLEGWPDALWYLSKDDEGTRFLRAEGRDIDVGEEQLQFEADSRSLSLGGWDRRTTAANRDADQVRDYVSVNPGATQNQIQGHLGWGVARTSKAINAAHLRKEGGPRNSTLHYAS
jgi:hypothetical protein